MKRLNVIAAAVFMCLTMTAFSQMSVGIKAGLNLANELAKDKDFTFSDDYSMKMGFHAGVTVGFSLTDAIEVEPALLYSIKGHKYDKNSVTYTSNLNYVEIPINIRYKVEAGPVKVFGQAGPYLGYGISGKMKSDDKIFMVDGTLTDEMDIDLGSDKDEDDMKPMDFGVNIGLGAEMKKFSLTVQYGLGLANLAVSTDNDEVMKNKVIGISLGYKFMGE